MKTHFIFNNMSENRAIYNAEKCGGARGATNDVTIWHIHVACWLSKATRARSCTHPGTCTRAPTHTQKYVILVAFPRQKWFANASQRYIIRTPPLFFTGPPSCRLSPLPTVHPTPQHFAAWATSVCFRVYLDSFDRWGDDKGRPYVQSDEASALVTLSRNNQFSSSFVKRVTCTVKRAI